MRLRTFDAPNLTDAMNRVRSVFGPDAVILSTETLEDGYVRITAAREDEDFLPMEFPRQQTDSRFHEELGEALSWHGVPEDLAERLLQRAHAPRSGDSVEALAAALEATLSFAAPPDETEERVLILAGPNGGGKTATAAKISARAQLAGKNTAIISMDAQKAGGFAQIAAFARALGTHLDFAYSAEALIKVAGNLPESDLIIVDTAGINPFSERPLGELRDAASELHASIAFVMAAGLDPIEAEEIGGLMRAAGASHLIPTRLDMTRRLAGLLSAADAGPLALGIGGVSAQVGNGLDALNPRTLSRRLMAGRLPKTSSSSATGYS